MTGPKPSSGLARRSSSTGPAWRSALERGRLSITEVLGVVPLEVTDALLDEFHHLADRHDDGYMVEHVLELLATS